MINASAIRVASDCISICAGAAQCMCKAIGIVFEYVLNASTLPVIVFEYDVRHSAQCSLCTARSIVFEYVRRRRLNCREPKAEVKIYRYNKTLAATDNHRPFNRIGHDNDDHDGGDGDDHDGGDGDDDDVGGGDFRNKRQ